MINQLLQMQDRLFPPNTKRRLFLSLFLRFLKNPRDVIAYLNPTSLRYFLYYLRRADPSLLEKLVDTALSRNYQAGKIASINYHLCRIATNRIPAPSIPPRPETVAIIIPVYNAPELTAACIESVLANSDNCRIIVVNDASTDERIRPMLDELRFSPAKRIEVTILHNECNLGFVKTVNLAYRHTRGHFVILNSDTEVPPGWLDRLFAPILASPESIASVTPFSNSGMGCSFPEPDKDFPLFKNLSLAEIDGIFSRYGSAEPIEIFTGVGFCMAFNRAVADRIGLFDEETFGKGYAEEADWSVRATEAGFRNVLVTNLFVYHKHGGSFSAKEKNRLLERNLARFWARHRSHMARHQEMAATDAPREIREALAVALEARTRGAARRVALIDVEMKGGGTIYSGMLSDHLRLAGMEVLHCKFDYSRSCMQVQVRSESLDTTVALPGDATRLRALLGFFDIDFVIVNELYSWPDPGRIMEELATGPMPYLAVVHDFFLVCPRWFLVDNDGIFCGLPAAGASCQKCVRGNAFSGHRDLYGDNLDDLPAWRRKVSAFLSGAEKVVCFSESTAGYFRRIYPQLQNIDVRGHAIPGRERFVWRQRKYDSSKPLVIGMIGNLIPVKGERIVQHLLDSPRFLSLPVRVKVFGVSPIYPAGYGSPDGKLQFMGGYRREDLPELLEREGISAILIPSVWPETFSYTTSEAILLGYPVICFNVGAPAERVKDYRCGIVADNISADALVAAMEQLLQNPHLLEELSRNTRRYEPATPEEHFGALTAVIAEATKERDRQPAPPACADANVLVF